MVGPEPPIPEEIYLKGFIRKWTKVLHLDYDLTPWTIESTKTIPMQHLVQMFAELDAYRNGIEDATKDK